jgi:hypothetical protein
MLYRSDRVLLQLNDVCRSCLRVRCGVHHETDLDFALE